LKAVIFPICHAVRFDTICQTNDKIMKGKILVNAERQR